jgi:hypothetical protein
VKRLGGNFCRPSSPPSDAHGTPTTARAAVSGAPGHGGFALRGSELNDVPAFVADSITWSEDAHNITEGVAALHENGEMQMGMMQTLNASDSNPEVLHELFAAFAAGLLVRRSVFSCVCVYLRPCVCMRVMVSVRARL